MKKLTKKLNILTLAILIVMGSLFVLSNTVVYACSSCCNSCSSSKKKTTTKKTTTKNTVVAQPAPPPPPPPLPPPPPPPPPLPTVVQIVSSLSVSCSASNSSSNTGDSINWSSSVSGGSGSYSYSWSGTDSLSGSGNSISKTYTSTGSKTATLTVTSGDKTASANCGYVSVSEYEQSLTGSCSVSDSNVNTDESVNWSASASGGNGSYTYEWSGSSPLSGKTGSNVNVYYSSTGSKTGRVTITSGSKSKTISCGTVYVDDNNDDENLEVSCSVSDRNIDVGEEVRFTAYGTGGTGSYSYEWSGSSPLDGRSGSNQYITYNSSGSKTARVTVRSGSSEVTRSCATVSVGGSSYYDDDSELNISCTVNNSNIGLGQTAQWNTVATGGNGSYSYSWSGTDGLYGNNSYISKVYNSLGSKNASVTVTSGSRTRTLNCPSVVVGSVAYQNPGNLASMSSVYLNQVPYTGIGDSPKFIAFIVSLIMFSALIAYGIIFRKSKNDRKNKILEFKRENMFNRGLIR